MKKSNLYFLILGIGLILLACSPASDEVPTDPDPPKENEREHPFLIVKAEEFPVLRDRAREEPWASMKTDAIRRSDDGFTWGSSNNTNAYNLQAYIGAVALAYILEEDRAQIHADRVRDAIVNHYARLDLDERNNWGGVVPNLGSFFVAILSLDIVYDALSTEDLRKCENVISNQISTLKREGSWSTVRMGTHGTWDIYQGDRTEPDEDYYQAILRQITDDGVSPVTIHYAWERIGGGNSRVSKSGYMDVLEYTGIDPRYYQNDRLQKFYRWLFGSSINPAKEMAIIGDMLPTQRLYNDMLHRRVINFDAEAAAYAAWFHEGRAAWGNILTYVIPKAALPAPKVPQSQWFENGGAFFREKADDPNGLHGVLYNIQSQDEWHTHQEINGLALSGLGNRLLVNGGRLGAPTRPAALNNTLTINGMEHTSRLGDGIVEGFTTDYLDYACGAAGPALSGQQHLRSLILVHTWDDVRPYFLVLDEVTADNGETVHNYFHPANESQVQEMMTGQIYQAPIDHYPTEPGTRLSFFFVTPAQSVQIEKVPSAVPDRYPGYPDHNRLEAIYQAADHRNQPIATVLYPHRNTGDLPTFDRLQVNELSGGSIRHNGQTTDYLLTAKGIDTHQYRNIEFQGKAGLFRETDGNLKWLFLQESTHFAQGDFSISTSDPLSLFFQDNTGSITSSGTELSLRGTGVETIQFEPAVTELQREAGLLRVNLPAGNVSFQ